MRSAGQTIFKNPNDLGDLEIVEDGSTRYLFLGSDAIQSAVDITNPATLQLSYTRAMMSFLLFNEKPQNILIIGLGGGAIPQFLNHYYPTAAIDVVETRGDVIEAAEEYFRVKAQPQIRIFPGDGRQFVVKRATSKDKRYDAIIVDAFTGSGIAQEVNDFDFFRCCRKILNNDGVAVFNLWGSDKKSFALAMEDLAHIFHGGLLRLPVPEKGNIIMLGFPVRVDPKQLPKLKEAAIALKERIGVEMPKWLRLIRRHNKSSWLANLLNL